MRKNLFPLNSRTWNAVRAVFLPLVILICLATASWAQRGAQSDPGATVTGNRHDATNFRGDSVTDSVNWPADVSKTPPPDTVDVSKDPITVHLADQAGQNRTAINTGWTLENGYLVMIMIAGFGLLEAGFCRKKHSARVYYSNLLTYSVCILGFWAVGFTLMFGGMASPPSSLGGINPLLPAEHQLPNQYIGTGSAMFLSAHAYDVGVFAMFLFQVVFMNTMGVIPTGAMAERWKLGAMVGYGLFASTILYPIYGRWVWGCGWLSHLGLSNHLGHGAVDFAGSGVVHTVGGFAALAGAQVLKPRLGRFEKGRAAEFAPSSLPMALTGTLVLAFGWFGFNSGSTLGLSGGGGLRSAVIATNTMLASASGAMAALCYWAIWCNLRAVLQSAMTESRKPNAAPGRLAHVRSAWKSGNWLDTRLTPEGATANGMLGGLVAITASCGYVTSVGAFWIGVVAGGLSCLFTLLLDKWEIDDPVGAFPVHGVCGVWGLISVGLLADGTYGKGVGVFSIGDEKFQDLISNDKYAKAMNDHGVTGLFYNGQLGQIQAQLISCLVCMAWAYVGARLFFELQNLAAKAWQKRVLGISEPTGIRATPQEEGEDLEPKNSMGSDDGTPQMENT